MEPIAVFMVVMALFFVLATGARLEAVFHSSLIAGAYIGLTTTVVVSVTLYYWLYVW